MSDSAADVSASAIDKAAPVAVAETNASTPPVATMPRPTLRAWLRDHDDKWPFVVLYLGASVLLSILISLFWLLVVIAVHLAFECFRQAHYRAGRKNVFLHALWEVKLDFGLAALAFGVALYIDVILGAVGIHSAARIAAATRVGVRAAAWERNLRTFLLTVDEISRIGHAVYTLRAKRRKGKGPATSPAYTTESLTLEVPPAWRLRWGWADRIGLTLVAAGTASILLAPLLTPHDLASSMELILEQLKPFPS
jgi:hypothetical protein